MEISKKCASSIKSSHKKAKEILNKSSTNGWMSNKGITVVFNIGPSFFHLLTKNTNMKRSFNYLFDSRQKMSSLRENIDCNYPKLPLIHTENIRTCYSKLAGKKSSVITVNIFKENCVCELCLSKSFLFFGSLPSDLHKEILRVLYSVHCSAWNIRWINILVAQLKLIFNCIKDGIVYENLLECATQCASVLQKNASQQDTKLDLLEFKCSYEFFHMDMRKRYVEVTQKQFAEKILPLLPFPGVGKEEIDIIDGVAVVSFENERDMNEFTKKELNYMQKVNISSLNISHFEDNERLLKKAESSQRIKRWKTRNLYPSILSNSKMKFKEYESKNVYNGSSVDMSSKTLITRTENQSDVFIDQRLTGTSSKTLIGPIGYQIDDVCCERSTEISTKTLITRIENQGVNISIDKRLAGSSSKTSIELKENQGDNIIIDKSLAGSSSKTLIEPRENLGDHDYTSVAMNVMQTFTASGRRLAGSSSKTLIEPTGNQGDHDYTTVMQIYNKMGGKNFKLKKSSQLSITDDVSPILNLRQQWLLNSQQAKKRRKLIYSSADEDYFCKKVIPPSTDYWNNSIIPVLHTCPKTDDVRACSCKTFSLCMILNVGRGRPLSEEAIVNLEALKMQRKGDNNQNKEESTLKKLLENSIDKVREQQKSEIDLILDHIHNGVANISINQKDASILRKSKRGQSLIGCKKQDEECNIISARMAHIAASALNVNKTMTRIIVPVVSESILRSVKNWELQLAIDQHIQCIPQDIKPDVEIDSVIKETIDDIVDYVELNLNPLNIPTDPDNIFSNKSDGMPKRRRKRRRRGQYAVQPTNTKCLKKCCIKGCICKSLNYHRRKHFHNHCGKDSCIFECICSNYEEQESVIQPRKGVVNQFLITEEGDCSDVETVHKERTKRERKFPSKFENSVCFAFEDEFQNTLTTTKYKRGIDDLYSPQKCISVKQRLIQHKLQCCTESIGVTKTLMDVFIWCDTHNKYECRCFSWICKLKENVLLWKTENRFKQNVMMSEIEIGPHLYNEIHYYDYSNHSARTIGTLIKYAKRNSSEIFKLKRYRELRRGIISCTNSYVKLKYCKVENRKNGEPELMKEDIIKAVSYKNIHIEPEMESKFNSEFIDVGSYSQPVAVGSVTVECDSETGNYEEQRSSIAEDNYVIDHSERREENFTKVAEVTTASSPPLCVENYQTLTNPKVKPMKIKRKKIYEKSKEENFPKDFDAATSSTSSPSVENCHKVAIPKVKPIKLKRKEILYEVSREENVPKEFDAATSSSSTPSLENNRKVTTPKVKPIKLKRKKMYDKSDLIVVGLEEKFSKTIPRKLKATSLPEGKQRLRCAPTYKLLDPRVQMGIYDPLNSSATVNILNNSSLTIPCSQSEMNMKQCQTINDNCVSVNLPMDVNQPSFQRSVKMAKGHANVLKKNLFIVQNVKGQRKEYYFENGVARLKRDLNDSDQLTSAFNLRPRINTKREQTEKLGQSSGQFGNRIFTVDLTKENDEEKTENLPKLKYVTSSQNGYVGLKQLYSDLESGVITLKDHPLMKDIYGPDNLPKLALLCLAPGIGYLPIVQFNQDILVVQDPRLPTLFHSFKNVESANLWFNRFLKNQIEFENLDTYLKWIVVKPGVLRIRQSHPFSPSILKNPSLIITKDGKLKFSPKVNVTNNSNIQLAAMEVNMNPSNNIAGRLLFENKRKLIHSSSSGNNIIDLCGLERKPTDIHMQLISPSSSISEPIHQAKKIKLSPVVLSSSKFLRTNTKADTPVRLKILNANKQKTNQLNLNAISSPYANNSPVIVASNKKNSPLNIGEPCIYFRNSTPQILPGRKNVNITTKLLTSITSPRGKMLTNKSCYTSHKKNTPGRPSDS